MCETFLRYCIDTGSVIWELAEFPFTGCPHCYLAQEELLFIPIEVRPMFSMESCHILHRDEEWVKPAAEQKMTITLVFAERTVIPLDSGGSERGSSCLEPWSLALGEGECLQLHQKKNLHWGYKPGLVSADDRYCGTPNTFKLNVDEGVWGGSLVYERAFSYKHDLSLNQP